MKEASEASGQGGEAFLVTPAVLALQDRQAVDRMIEARLDWDHFAVELQGHVSQVRPFPISVESWAERHVLAAWLAERR